jgi:hypothetical protein
MGKQASANYYSIVLGLALFALVEGIQEKTRNVSFDYNSIPPGYYFGAMLKGKPPQRFWHKEKFREVINTIPQDVDRYWISMRAGSLTYLAASFAT